MTRAFCALAASRSATVSADAAATDAAASAKGTQAASRQCRLVVCASWGLLRGRGSDIALPSLALRRRGRRAAPDERAAREATRAARGQRTTVGRVEMREPPRV